MTKATDIHIPKAPAQPWEPAYFPRLSEIGDRPGWLLGWVPLGDKLKGRNCRGGSYTEANLSIGDRCCQDALTMGCLGVRIVP